MERTPYRPPVTVALVGLNILVFAAMVATGVPIENRNIFHLLKWGADFGPQSLGGQPWRMLTSNYVHVGIIHLTVNMWGLWQVGRLAERIFGKWTYLLIYTACGIAGSLASLLWNPMGVSAVVAVNLYLGAVIAAIDNAGHVGGLVMGLALGAVLGPQLMEPPDRRRAHERIVFVAAVFLLIGGDIYVRHKNGYVTAFSKAAPEKPATTQP